MEALFKFLTHGWDSLVILIIMSILIVRFIVGYQKHWPEVRKKKESLDKVKVALKFGFPIVYGFFPLDILRDPILIDDIFIAVIWIIYFRGIYAITKYIFFNMSKGAALGTICAFIGVWSFGIKSGLIDVEFSEIKIILKHLLPIAIITSGVYILLYKSKKETVGELDSQNKEMIDPYIDRQNQKMFDPYDEIQNQKTIEPYDELQKQELIDPYKDIRKIENEIN